ncbi:MAG: DUF3656 domain-containing protein, partial [Parasporobacterium sp.]|nr:DUF3656 domain-containing protein [Parasporobacterium sp.]
VYARAGSPLRLEVTPSEGEISRRPELSGIRITEEGGVVEKAGSRPTEPDQLLSKLQKTGGTNVKLTGTCQMDEDIFVPMSEFNNMRREAVDRLKDAVSGVYRRRNGDFN